LLVLSEVNEVKGVGEVLIGRSDDDGAAKIVVNLVVRLSKLENSLVTEVDWTIGGG
jgi:hypothetical protein